MVTKKKIDPFFWIAVFSTVTVVVFIIFPLTEMVLQPSVQDLKDAIYDPDVLGSIGLSIYTSGMAGIAILGLAGKNHWLGQMMQQVGIQIMGTVTGIVTVLTFVGLPFYVNTVKAGFEAIPVRLENISRSLGASLTETFVRVTFRLAWRSMLVGIIMCSARAISEFGAVVIVAYHPMIAPVMIYERFTAYGIKYSQPVAVWLIVVSLLLFLLLRICSLPKENQT
jgi:molybdate/tungstate transport system permease protein